MNSKLLKKTIDLKELSVITGEGNFCNSGGTESSPTAGGNDSIINTYDDDCNLASTTYQAYT